MNAARQNDLETVSLEENVPLIEGGDVGRGNGGKQAVVGNNILESNKVSFGGTFLNLLKSSLGAGLLGFPFGFRKAGWLGGIISCLVLSCITGFGYCNLDTPRTFLQL